MRTSASLDHHHGSVTCRGSEREILLKRCGNLATGLEGHPTRRGHLGTGRECRSPEGEADGSTRDG